MSSILDLQLLYAQSSSPARTRNECISLLRSDADLRLLSSLAGTSEPDEQLIARVKESLSNITGIINAKSTDATDSYLYFEDRDRLLSARETDATPYIPSNQLVLATLKSMAIEPGDTKTHTVYGYDSSTGTYLTTTATALFDGVYYIGVHSYTEDTNPSIGRYDILQESAPEMAIGYYDPYGNAHYGTEDHELVDLFTYELLGPDPYGSISFHHNGNDYLAVYRNNPDNQTRIALFYRDTITEQGRIYLLLLGISAAGTIALALLVAFLLLRHSLRPLEDLAHHVAPNHTVVHDEVGTLAQAFDTQEGELNRRSDLLRQCYLLGLMNDLDTSAIEDFRDPEITDTHMLFLVILLRIETVDVKRDIHGDDVVQFQIDALEAIGVRTFALPLGDCLGIIVSAQPVSIDRGQLVQRVKASLLSLQSQSLPYEFSAYLSTVVSSQNLRQAYEEAHETLKYYMCLEQYGRIACYEEVKDYIPSDEAPLFDYGCFNELSRAIRDLDSTAALSHLDGIAFQMSRELGRPLDAGDAAFSLMVNMVTVALYNVDIPKDLNDTFMRHHTEELQTARTIGELRSTVQATLMRLERMGEDPDDEQKMFGAMKAYINERYADPNLSAAVIGNEFHLSPSGITRLFQKYNQTGFLQYVHELRVEKACTLLKDSNLTVPNVATHVGYGNAITMTRAFKKYRGTTPGLYRKYHRGLQKDWDDNGSTQEDDYPLNN